MTVRQLLQNVGGSPEITYWMAYFKNENEDRLRSQADARAQSALQDLKSRRRGR